MKGGPDRSLGVILLRPRRAEHGQPRPSPSLLSTWPPSPVTAFEASSRKLLRRLRRVLNVESGRKFGRANKISEHDCDWASFGQSSRAKDCVEAGATARRAWAGRGSCAPSSAIALSSRLRSPRGTPSSSRSPSVRSASTSKSILLSKLFFVSTEAETTEPHADIHRRAPHVVPRYSLSGGALSSTSPQNGLETHRGRPCAGGQISS